MSNLGRIQANITRIGRNVDGRRVAVLYPSNSPRDSSLSSGSPLVGGSAEYAANVAYVLSCCGVQVVKPRCTLKQSDSTGWVFPDTEAGIGAALAAGADVLWAETLLFENHPIGNVTGRVWTVGQIPRCAGEYRNKWVTNVALRRAGCLVAASLLIGQNGGIGTFEISGLTTQMIEQLGFSFPLVIKPVRGRHGTGVRIVGNLDELSKATSELFELPTEYISYATLRHPLEFILEQYLPGEEISVTVMPPGSYDFATGVRKFENYWALPPLRRTIDGSEQLNTDKRIDCHTEDIPPSANLCKGPAINRLIADCLLAARIVEAVAPIRIDARKSLSGDYLLFDLNMKTRLIGPGRPWQQPRNSLTGLAAQAIGWSYTDLLVNVLRQAWRPKKITTTRTFVHFDKIVNRSSYPKVPTASVSEFSRDFW